MDLRNAQLEGVDSAREAQRQRHHRFKDLESPTSASEAINTKHAAQHRHAHKHGDDEVRLCARLMRERLCRHEGSQDHGKEEIKLGMALAYLTSSGEATNEYQAARLGQRMVDIEIWYHKPSSEDRERKDFTLDLGPNEVFRFASTAPLPRLDWKRYHAAVEEERDQQSRHHAMEASNTPSVLVLKLKQALTQKQIVHQNAKLRFSRAASHARLLATSGDLAGVATAAAAVEEKARKQRNVGEPTTNNGTHPEHDVPADFSSRRTFESMFANGDKDKHGRHVCTKQNLDEVLNDLERKEFITLPQDRQHREEVSRKIFSYLDETGDRETINATGFVNVSAATRLFCNANRRALLG